MSVQYVPFLTFLFLQVYFINIEATDAKNVSLPV